MYFDITQVAASEYSRKCLAMVPPRQFRSDDVLAVLPACSLKHGPTGVHTFRQRPEFAAGAIRELFGRLGVKTLFIKPGSPWENG
jgi:putative transposase